MIYMKTIKSKVTDSAKRLGDRVFSGSALFAALMIMVILATVALFLIVRSAPAFFATSETASLLKTNFWQYALPLIFGTVWAALLALLMALPVAIGIALFISHYAPRQLAGALGYIVDLLAAVGSARGSAERGFWSLGYQRAGSCGAPSVRKNKCFSGQFACFFNYFWR